MPERRKRVVYVTYDGIEDPLGRSQVLPYVEGLARRGHAFELVSFEKPGVPLRFRERLAAGVRWTALRYHRTPTVPATAFDMAQGASLLALQKLFIGADLVHVRSYVAATLALPCVRALRTPMLFDMRGLWPDEKADIGTWPRGGRLYAAAKKMERVLLRNAAFATVLTHAMQRYLRDDYPYRSEVTCPIHVIPTCADLAFFNPETPKDENLARELEGATVLAYVGSLGAWYMQDEMVRFYEAFRREVPRARLLVVTRDQPTELRALLARFGAEGELVHRSAKRDEVAKFVRCADAALCFVRPTFSKLGSAPTKVGEILGCGLPVAANIVGDLDRVLGESPAGVVVSDMSEDALARAARQLADAARRPTTRSEARAVAERWFGLEAAVAAYDRIYEAIGSARGARADATWPSESRFRPHSATNVL